MVEVDISNINTNFREIIRKNNGAIKKVVTSYFFLFFLIGFLYDFALAFVNGNLSKNYELSQKKEQCIDCYIGVSELVSDLLTFEKFPIFTCVFMSVALLSVVYAKFCYKSVLFNGLSYRNMSEELSLGEYIRDGEKIALNILEEMSIASSLKYKPELYLYDDEIPNGFSLTVNDREGLIGISTGALELPRDELTVLFAHEFAHLKCEDSKVSFYVDTLTSSLHLLLEFILDYCTFILNIVARLPVGKNNYKNLIFVIFFLLTLALRVFIPVVTFVLKRFLNKASDFRADALAMKYTRDPMALNKLLKRGFDNDYDNSLVQSGRHHSCFFSGDGSSNAWYSNFINNENILKLRYDNTLKNSYIKKELEKDEY